MEETGYIQLENALEELDNHIRMYEKRADEMWKGRNPVRYESDKRRAELFKVIRKEVGGVIPKHTEIRDGGLFCPTCGANIERLYEPADDAGIPINFCPCCRQAFTGRVEP